MNKQTHNQERIDGIAPQLGTASGGVYCKGVAVGRIGGKAGARDGRYQIYNTRERERERVPEREGVGGGRIRA